MSANEQFSLKLVPASILVQLLVLQLASSTSMQLKFELSAAKNPEKLLLYPLATLRVVNGYNSKFYGFFAWLVWMGVHLRSILGVKNKFVVLMNWIWNYFTYNLSLRLIINRASKE